VYALRTQPNVRVHLGITALVLVIGAWAQLSVHDWAVIMVTIAVVFSAEFLNTAIEAVVDLASPNQHALAKAAKDVAAAAVLVTALGAVLVGVLIIGPPLLARLASLAGR
jgi:undecaprenol kinase/diacylglycerol kinase (ATP)